MNRVRRTLAALRGEETGAPPAPIASTVSPATAEAPFWLSRWFAVGLCLLVIAAAIVWILWFRDPHSAARRDAGAGDRNQVGRVVNYKALEDAAREPDRRDQPKPDEKKEPETPPVQINEADIKAGMKSFGKWNRAQQVASRGQGEGEGEDQGAFGNALRVSRLRGTRPTRIQNPHLMMKPGTTVPCVTDHAMDNGSGFIFATCTTSEPGWNMTGTIPLIPANSTITLQGERATAQGETRVFITAATATGRYPGGHYFSIDLMSAAADALGRTGVQGERDTQFWQRLQGSILLGMVGSAAAVGQNALLAQGLPAGPALGAAGQAAATSLQYSVNIPVRVRVRQGEKIAVVLNRFADFSNQLDIEEIAR